MTRDLFGRSFGDNQAPLIAGVRAKIDDPIRALDNLEVVLNDQDGMAGFDQALEHHQQHTHVVEVQSGSRFVKEEQYRFAIASAETAWPVG